jgi:hypothetical protein
MEWVCVVLIIGSMVYSGSIVVEYTNYNLEIRPQINKLEHKTTEWANSAQLEIEERELIKKEIESTRHVVSDLQLGVDEAKLRRQAALLRKKRLEMALLKSSIRSRRTTRMNTV